MPLEIEFLDGPPAMDLGEQARLRVVQQGAAGAFTVQIDRVGFTFDPIPWGRVTPTADPGIGLLEVVELVDDTELLAPHYSIRAHLTEQAGQTLASGRRIRLVPQALEVELAFEVGREGSWRRFAPSDLPTPLDWSRARVGDAATQSLYLRDGRPYLRVSPPSALPAQVEVTFPNGEVARLILEGPLAIHEPGQQPAATPAAAQITAPAATPASALESPAPAPAASPASFEAPAAPHEELTRLQRYVASFAGAPRHTTDARTAQGIRERVERELERVGALIDGYAGPDRDELRARFGGLVQEVERGLLSELKARIG